MSKGNLIKKNIKLSLYDIVRFQLNNYCFINKIRLSPAQLDCLALLGMYGEMNISDFCEETVKESIFSNNQTARNFITKSVKESLVKRSGNGNKIISVNQDLSIFTEGNILIELKVYYVDTNKSKELNT